MILSVIQGHFRTAADNGSFDKGGFQGGQKLHRRGSV